MAQVIIRVKPDGQAEVKAEGWQGPTCSTITEPFRRALGKEVTNEPTDEMYQEQTQRQELSQ